MAQKKKRVVDVSGDTFGIVLNCAVRYAIGRRTYMPGLVIDFIAPLIPNLSNETLRCLDRDITEARWESGYGDPYVDEPAWIRLLAEVQDERIKRGERPYKSWREQ